MRGYKHRARCLLREREAFPCVGEYDAWKGLYMPQPYSDDHDLHEDGGRVHWRQETLTHWRLENGNWRLKIDDFRCKMQKKVKLFPICLHMWEFFCNFAADCAHVRD